MVSTWNDNGHTDHLYGWSWARYLAEVRTVLTGKEEDVLAPEQEDALKFAQGQLKCLEGGPSPAEPGPGRRGWRFAKQVCPSSPDRTAQPKTRTRAPDRVPSSRRSLEPRTS